MTIATDLNGPDAPLVQLCSDTHRHLATFVQVDGPIWRIDVLYASGTTAFHFGRGRGGMRQCFYGS